VCSGWSRIYLRWVGAPLRLRAAHRAFIKSESLFLPAAVSPPFRFGCVVSAAGVFPRLRLAHRARCAAAILARAAGDMLRRPRGFCEAGCRAPEEVPNSAVRRASKLSICRRIRTASSSDLRDRFIKVDCSVAARRPEVKSFVRFNNSRVCSSSNNNSFLANRAELTRDRFLPSRKYARRARRSQGHCGR
jgi:hypothetical protein